MNSIGNNSTHCTQCLAQEVFPNWVDFYSLFIPYDPTKITLRDAHDLKSSMKLQARQKTISLIIPKVTTPTKPH